tara:strand:+ start:1292 stop:2431 length:1140 start_codon:yes stop_codon:yes gene_type:complete
MSINPIEFYNALENNGINFFTGVPDSLLKQFCLCLDDKKDKIKHIIAANEGNAIALAAGYHLGTGDVPLVYMQNSGLGNAINPILSLCDKDVYSIPMLIIIGWRGEPGVIDEPQHFKQGRVQLQLLESMNINYCIIDKDTNDIKKNIENAVNKAKSINEPFALLVKKDTFSNYHSQSLKSKLHSQLMQRECALEVLMHKFPQNSIIVSTTGKTSREIFEIRDKIDGDHSKDFLTVGSMGHCSSIALGIAISNPNKKVICIDGDGALLMHLGSLSTISKIKPNNFYHILLNNEVHESVGGQETSIKHINVKKLMESHYYNKVLSIDIKEKIIDSISDLLRCNGPNFLEIKVKPGSRENLGRPSIKPKDNKDNFMNFIKNS